MNVRFARHTNNLEAIKSFYIGILGLELLGSFENHNGYDGVFIGIPNTDWHLEFTKSNEKIAFNFNEDDILVFYPNTKIEFNILITNLLQHNISSITSKNPYWNINGQMYLDPDGYRVVISHLKIA
jgi:catechol 2,3-dioxygenase-like lactoylglutathione lyase family enzyme